MNIGEIVVASVPLIVAIGAGFFVLWRKLADYSGDLGKVNGSVNGMKESVKTSVDDMKKSVDTMNGSINELNGSVVELKTTVGGHTKDIRILKGGLTGVRRKLGRHIGEKDG